MFEKDSLQATAESGSGRIVGMGPTGTAKSMFECLRLGDEERKDIPHV